MSRRVNPQRSIIAAAVLAAMLGALGTAANAQLTTPGPTPKTAPAAPGYVGDAQSQAVVNPYGLCWHSGSWTPADAAAPCDAVPRPAVAVVVAPPPPVVVVAPAPKPPVIEKVTLSSDVLFDFNKATLKEGGKEKLDELVARVKDAKVEEITAVGHADRIASEEYNQKLSEERAQAVKEYLVEKGVPESSIKTEGKGKSEPVTVDDCKNMGPEKASNRKLVACLQPDRRVDIEVAGTRVAAASPAGAGGTTSGSSTSSPK